MNTAVGADITADDLIEKLEQRAASKEVRNIILTTTPSLTSAHQTSQEARAHAQNKARQREQQKAERMVNDKSRYQKIMRKVRALVRKNHGIYPKDLLGDELKVVVRFLGLVCKPNRRTNKYVVAHIRHTLPQHSHTHIPCHFYVGLINLKDSGRACSTFCPLRTTAAAILQAVKKKTTSTTRRPNPRTTTTMLPRTRRVKPRTHEDADAAIALPLWEVCVWVWVWVGVYELVCNECVCAPV